MPEQGCCVLGGQEAFAVHEKAAAVGSREGVRRRGEGDPLAVGLREGVRRREDSVISFLATCLVAPGLWRQLRVSRLFYAGCTSS